jgi:hypothetical protein
MTSRFLFRAAALTACLLLWTSGALAQEAGKQKIEKESRETVIRQDKVWVGTPPMDVAPLPGDSVFNIRVPPAGPGPLSDTVVFLSSEFNFDGKTVKNAPYSADAVTETVQVLSDGNRIVRRTNSTVYRDSEGRTRSEQTLTGIGPFPVAGDPVRTISISDPVSGFSYVLDERGKVARKMYKQKFFYRSTKPGSEDVVVMAPGGATTVHGKAGIAPGKDVRVIEMSSATAASAPGTGGVAVAASGSGVAVAGTRVIADGPVTRAFGEAPKTESLGTQMIEGVSAEGTRTTVTIPAGQIGNERPIEIVSERWYSPELQVVVLSKRNDPMTGDMTYKLTNINRNEPVRSLFEVPGDFKIEESPVPGKMKILKPAEKP